MRFELTTASLATKGSTTELHPQMYGAAGGSRTPNLLDLNQTPLPIGLQRHICKIGREGGIRTLDRATNPILP